MATLNIGGKTVQVDDSFLRLSPEEQQATVEEISSSLGSKPQMGATDTAMDVAKSGGIGLAKGAISLAGLPGDVQRLAGSANDWIKEKTGYGLERDPSMLLPGSQEIQKGIEGYTGEFYKPQSTAGEYAQTIGEFAPGGLIGGARTAGRRVAGQVVAPAVVSETAGQLTQGTAAEPFARIGGAIAGGAAGLRFAAPQPARSPTRQQLDTAADNAYKSPEIANLQFQPHAGQDVQSTIRSQLLNNKIDELAAPKTMGALDPLQNPRFGPAGTVSDFDMARQTLSQAGRDEPRAAGIARQEIDKYLGNVPQSHVLSGDAAAANAKLLEARGNYAASKRDKEIMDALGRAENQAGSTYSGGNLENATRQQLKPILNSKEGVSKSKAFQDYTPEEIAALKTAVNGTTWGNTVRGAAKLVGGGGGIGNLAAGSVAYGGSHTAGADPATSAALGLAAVLGGRGLNAYGNRLATQRAEKLSELLRSRSPLAQQQAAARPPQQKQLSAQQSALINALLARQSPQPAQ